jgi:hypothetical protein
MPGALFAYGSMEKPFADARFSGDRGDRLTVKNFLHGILFEFIVVFFHTLILPKSFLC